MFTTSILNTHDANIFYAGYISGLNGTKSSEELKALRSYRELVLFREAESLGKKKAVAK